jgi:hypothetical protein
MASDIIVLRLIKPVPYHVKLALAVDRFIQQIDFAGFDLTGFNKNKNKIIKP